MPKRIIQKVMSDEKCQHFRSEKMDAQVIAGPSGSRKLNLSGKDEWAESATEQKAWKVLVTHVLVRKGVGKAGCCLALVNLTQAWATSEKELRIRSGFIRLTCGDSCRAQPTVGSTTAQQMALGYVRQQVEQACKQVLLCCALVPASRFLACLPWW